MRPAHLKQFLAGALLSLGTGTALLGLHFVFQLPTSDYRARLYFLLWGAPLTVGSFYLGALLVVGLAASALTGWRSRTAYGGAAVGALIAWFALYFRVFSSFVWLHEEDVTGAGRLVRVVLATALLAFTLAVARRARRLQSSRELAPAA
jgi:hypothetical protein